MNMISLTFPRRMALTTGISLWAMALLAGFSFGYSFDYFFDTEAKNTFAHLQNAPVFFRVMVLGMLGVWLLDIVTAWSLYGFFRQADEPSAALMAWLRLGYCMFLAVAIASLASAQAIVEAGNMVLIQGCFQTFTLVWAGGLIIFGVHLLFLAALMRKRGLPNYLTIFTAIAGLAYLGSNIAHLLMPDYLAYKPTVDGIIALPAALGELGIATWLWIKGGR